MGEEINLWEFCTGQTEVSVSKLAEKLDIPYTSLYNWWRGFRHGQDKRPTLAYGHLTKLKKWATERGYR